MTNETGPEESGGGLGVGAVTEPGLEPATLIQQEEQLAGQDPQLAQELRQQELAAQQQIAADPTQAAPIELHLEQAEIADVAQVDPQLADELAAQLPVDAPDVTSPVSPQVVLRQVEELTQHDPQLAAEIQRQELAMEQAVERDPLDAQQLETAFLQTAVEEITPVDPQLAQELAAELAATPPTSAPTSPATPPASAPTSPATPPASAPTSPVTPPASAPPAPQPQAGEPPAPSTPEPAPAPPPQQVDIAALQFAQQDPQVAAEIQQQSTQANEQAIQDPQKAAQIEGQLAQTVIREVAQVDPRFAAELSAQLNAVDLSFNAQGEPEQGPDPTNQVLGDPDKDASQWTNQGADGYCGPNSVSMMLEAAAGVHISEQQVVEWATAHHEMSPLGDDSAGIPSIHVGMNAVEAADAINQLGKQYGVTAEVKYGNMSDLEGYLKQGREVMVAVDAQQLWHSPGQPDPGMPDHWVVVTGFDPSTDTVYINDPGVIYGREEAVPLKEFESTWATSNDVMVVTETAKANATTNEQAAPTPGPVLLPIRLDGSLVRPA